MGFILYCFIKENNIIKGADLMGKILGAYLYPHPPILLGEIGKGEEEKAINTIKAMEELSRDIKHKSPSTIVIITPHGALFRDAISISAEEILVGDFSRFGQANLKYSFNNNLNLVNKIGFNAASDNISVVKIDNNTANRYNIEKGLDHGTLVPLHFVNKEYINYRLVHITYGLLPPMELYKFGRAIKRAIIDSEETAIIIASGDLCHRPSNFVDHISSPYKRFEEKIVKIIREGKMEDIVSFDLELAEEGRECGLRCLMIMAGTLDKYKLKTEVLSYEAPYGVGYSTAKLDIIGEDNERDLLKDIEAKKRSKLDHIRAEESIYVKLARESLEHYIKTGKYIKIPSEIPQDILNSRKGVFVTLKKDGVLRGCIGTIQATEKNVPMEIIKNAVSAGTKDPRFDSVEASELDDLVYSVDLLSESEAIESINELDVKNYGIIVSHGYKKGLLLPNLEGVDTVEEQLSIALSKANISHNDNYNMERFRVKRYY